MELLEVEEEAVVEWSGGEVMEVEVIEVELDQGEYYDGVEES